MQTQGRKLQYLMRRNQPDKEQYFGRFSDEELFIVIARYPGNHWYYNIHKVPKAAGQNLIDLGTLASCAEALKVLGLELE